MSIFEYDEEKHMKSEREEWREIGREEGREEGLEEGLSIGRKEGRRLGREEGIKILKSLMDAGKTEELQRALSDSAYLEQLCKEYVSSIN